MIIIINFYANFFYFSEFEEKAQGTSKEIFIKTHDLLNIGLVLHISPFYNQSLLALGYNCYCRRFISEPSVQNVLDKIWNYKFMFEFDNLFIINGYIFYYLKVHFVKLLTS